MAIEEFGRNLGNIGRDIHPLEIIGKVGGAVRERVNALFTNDGVLGRTVNAAAAAASSVVAHLPGAEPVMRKILEGLTFLEGGRQTEQNADTKRE